MGSSHALKLTSPIGEETKPSVKAELRVMDSPMTTRSWLKKLEQIPAKGQHLARMRVQPVTACPWGGEGS
jgi:hypothetical protein